MQNDKQIPVHSQISPEEQARNELCDKTILAIDLAEELKQLERKEQEIANYKNATDERLVAFVSRYLNGQNKEDSKSKFVIGQINEKQTSDITKLVGFRVDNYVHVITANTVRHITNRHGAKGSQDKSMQDIRDIARVKYVLNNYDSVQKSTNDRYLTNENGNPAQAIIYKKRVNGTMVVIESVPDNLKKEIIVKSMYKTAIKEEVSDVQHSKRKSEPER